MELVYQKVWSGSEDDSEALEAPLRNYYRVGFALLRGCPQGRQLPFELVIQICRFADFRYPLPSKRLSVLHEQGRQYCRPVSWSPMSDYDEAETPRLKTGPIFKTPPLVKEDGTMPRISHAEICIEFWSPGTREHVVSTYLVLGSFGASHH